MGSKLAALRRRPATAGLIVVCTLVFAVVFALSLARAGSAGVVGSAVLASAWQLEDIELLRQAGALVASRVWLDGQWWRVASAGLLHGSWLHLGLNMLGLWVVGQWTESVWGPWRQLALFALASVGGCLASLAWAEAPVVVGASAGIFGVAGALVIARASGDARTQEQLEPVSARVLGSWLGFWLLVGFALAWAGVSVLAQAGHVGGLVVGTVVGWGWSRAPERRFSRMGAGFAALAMLLGLAWGARAPSWRGNYDLFMGFERLERGEAAAAVEHFDRALARDPGDAELSNAIAYSLAEARTDLERAEDLVRDALAVDGDNADYLDTLGWVLCLRGEVDEGLEVLAEAEQAARREIPEIGLHMEQCADAGATAD